MSQAKYPKAYEAYQQAVYRDGRNPTFWCSIGVLYYQINQYRDALDAYSRAIRLNPYISEVWYDLGTLVSRKIYGDMERGDPRKVETTLMIFRQYESCNNQIADALDAYSRAADLDPTNVHIKARLQLLQSQLAGSNQNNGPAPQPQDVHPQAYQAPGVGAPPAPQWAAPAPTGGPPPQAPAPPRQIADWNRGINEVQAQPQPHVINGFDHRDGGRTLVSAQQPSPRQEQVRAFPEPVRAPPAPRSPKATLTVTNASYPPSHTLPQLAGTTAPPLDRVPNTSASFASPARAPLTPAPVSTAANTPNGIPVTAATLPPYHRPFTPPTEIRPIREERPSSPGSTYPHQQYHHGPSVSVQVVNAGIAGGAPPPAAAITAAEAAAREREERPASAMKRGREWEAEPGPSKKIANEESRARLDEHLPRRVTPPNRMPSPGEMQRRESSEARREEQRRANDNYHPSEAAHHPPTLPSIQHMQPHPSSSLPPIDSSVPSSNGAPSGPPPAESQVKEEPIRNEQQLAHEPAARKMDVDENYDDDVDDEKRANNVPKGSPHGSGTGSVNNNTNGVLSNGAQASQSKPEP